VDVLLSYNGLLLAANFCQATLPQPFFHLACATPVDGTTVTVCVEGPSSAGAGPEVPVRTTMKMSKLELYAEAIKLELARIGVDLGDFSYEGNNALKPLKLSSSQAASAFNNLGCALRPNELTSVGATTILMSQKDCFINAIACLENFAVPYFNLGRALSGGPQRVTLLNGRSLTEVELYTEAINCDPMYGEAYSALGGVMGDREVTLRSGVKLTKRDALALGQELE
jgi:hypothetical protein